MAEISSYVSGYHAYVAVLLNSRARTELSSAYKFAIAVILENDIVGLYLAPAVSQFLRKDCKNI